MRVMVLMKATEESEKGFVPTPEGHEDDGSDGQIQ